MLEDLTGDEHAHLSVMEEAFFIYRERTGVRGQLWREFPPSDKIRMIKEKAARMNAAYTLVPDEEVTPERVAAMEDDALDIINFAVFFVRQIREGSRG